MTVVKILASLWWLSGCVAVFTFWLGCLPMPPDADDAARARRADDALDTLGIGATVVCAIVTALIVPCWLWGW